MKTFSICLLLLGFNASAQVLKDLKGEVKIKSNVGADATDAKDGQTLAQLDTVITGNDGSCAIQMKDRNQILVYPDSRFQIEEYVSEPDQGKKSALFNLIGGKVRAKVGEKYDDKTQRFRISSPVAICGVRGTDFIMTYDDAKKMSEVTTLRGEVHFGLPGPDHTILKSQLVKSGRRSEVSAGKEPTEAKAVPEKTLRKLRRDRDRKAEHEAASKHRRKSRHD